MHPVTPVLNAWKMIAALFFLVVWQLWPQLAAGDGLGTGRALLGLGALLVLGALGGSAYAAVAWRMTRYAVDDERVYLQSGVLFRRLRQARLDRLQAVDVVQPLVARLVGLAQLTVEQAGGSDSKVALAYLTEARAHELRNEILARAAGLQLGRAAPAVPIAPPGDVGGMAELAPQAPQLAPQARELAPQARELAPEAPEHEVLAVPVGRVLASIALSGSTVLLVVLVVGVVVATAVTESIGPLGALLPLLAAGATYAWGRFTGEFAFRAAISPDGIRLRHGLTESRAQTVPPGRVQAIRLAQPWLWRSADWWRVRINVAGYGDAESTKESVLLPVGTREEALLAVWLVLPDLGEPQPRGILEAGLVGRDDEGGFVPSPRRARWLDPVAWRRNGLRVTPAALLLRSGRLTRQLDLVPHERTQSLGLTQGPLQRRLRLSSFVVHSTPGPVTPQVQHLDAEVAARILMLQAERARTARAAAGPEQWMRRAAPSGTPGSPPLR
jgi:putative membrane protein